ncbi:polysaccharide biosynthesis C-terminal domain-containing protein [Ornithinicoccus hortensis]|uniref:oligosaccharide flippase family protein n=1 Tax=Ornithinicoccus hortensis TaxID=82346 RepID=UPI001478F1A6|nr:polysaccharide biosynthesis C-terminal domain-containing protein [Ornithinicoccus hortensis]
MAASERTQLAKGVSVTFVGSVVSAALGFVLTFALARLLGEAGAGVVMQAMGVFTIVTVIGKLGLDSAALWLLPRLLIDHPAGIRGVLTFALSLTAVVGVLLGLGIWWAAPLVWRASDEGPVGESIQSIAWAVPLGALVLVALAVVRAFGQVVPFVAVGSIFLPGARPLLVVAVVLAGGGAVAATVAWALPLVLALAILLLLIRAQLQKVEGAVGGLSGWLPTRGQIRRVIGFSLPRTVSAALEQGLVWLDVLVVGLLSTASAAGIYGAASRFIAAGLMIDVAIRVIVSPRFSALMHEGRLAELQGLYRTAAGWLVLFATPGFVILAVFAPAALSLLGSGFTEGATALMVLCLGVSLTFMAGNIHSLLLMSGHSGWAAVNKAVALFIMVVGNLALVPALGIIGAAIAWASAMLVDAGLAVWQVKKLVGVQPELRITGSRLLVAAVATGVPAVIVRLTAGEGVIAMLGAAACAGAVFVAVCFLYRDRLDLAGLRA